MSGAFSTAFSAAYDTVTTGPVWVPGDPWPGTPGGAALGAWSGYVRVYLHANIAAGEPFTMGPDVRARLDAGNVMWRTDLVALEVTPSALWVDLSCDLVALDIGLGSNPGDGILSKSEAGTLTATLYDPDGRYDPLNPETPYALGGKTRLTPGAPVKAWAEVIADPAATPATVVTFPLFSGTADRWSQDWKSHPVDRFAKLVASDPTKTWARFDLPEQSYPLGAGDSVLQRLNRLILIYGWGGTAETFGATTATLQATTAAQPGWELATRVAADELGFLYFVPQGPASTSPGVMACVAREVWMQRPPPAFEVGCGPGLHDIAVQAVPASFDAQLRNAAYVARTGGTQQTAKVQSSIDQYWEQSIQRTDLGLVDDTQAGVWATTIVSMYAYPQASLDAVVLRPDVDPAPWAAWQGVLGIGLVTDVVRVLWETGGYTVDIDARVVGYHHDITAERWEVEWRTVSAAFGSLGTFHLGPHANDALDTGFVLA